SALVFRTESGGVLAEVARFNSSGNFLIGSTTGTDKLIVGGRVTANNFFATSSSATSTFSGGVQIGSGSTGVTALTNGRFGIGQVAPLVKLAVGAVTAALSTNVGATGVGISGTGSISLGAENVSASGASAGAIIGLYSNDGAAMASGDRLGG
ncbi:hypothetical protein, partial [Escherichia coli]|uniref:hypothetical protein n=1 Tax=Escherichia coli TaxID=562 RepID=UPI00396C53F3